MVNVGWEGVGVTGHIPDNIGVSRHTPTEEGVATPFWIIVTIKGERIREDGGSWDVAFSTSTIIIVKIDREFVFPNGTEMQGSKWSIRGVGATG